MEFNAESDEPGVCNRGIVFDADGLLVPWPVKGDTVTGVVLCQVRHPPRYELLFREDEERCIKEWRRFKAPLTVEPVPDNLNLTALHNNHPLAPYSILRVPRVGE